MKILMFSRVKIFDGHLRGGAKRFYELYIQLQKYHDVEMCTVDDSCEYERRGIKGTVFPGVLFNRENPIKSIYEILSTTKHRINEINHTGYERIIVFGIPSAIVLSIYNVKKMYLFLRDDLIGYRKISMGYPGRKLSIKNRIYLWSLKLIEGVSIKKSDKIVVQCHHDLEELKKRHRLYSHTLEKKTIIQINNVNPTWIVNNSGASSMDLGNEGKIKIGFLGNFNNEQKGNRIFLEAISCIDNQDVVFFVGGTGTSEEELRIKYADMNNIHFSGWISNPCAFIKACDLIIVPSLADSCPNTVMESLYCGIPVIGSNRGGIPEILNKKDWTFNPDVQSIRDAIVFVLQSDHLSVLKQEQKLRKEELMFDWAKKIVEIIA